MPLINREVILAKVETTYGIDSAPTGAADAILVMSPSYSNEGVKMIDRAAVRASLGKLKQIHAGMLGKLSFSCEIKGSGSAGVAPEIGPLLRACGMGETIVGGTSVEYKPASSSIASLTIYYYQDGLLRKLTGARGNVKVTLKDGDKGVAEFEFTGHTKQRGTAASATATTIVLPSTYPATDDVFNGFKITITSGTGAGQEKTISDYTGSSKTCTVSTWTVTPDSTSVFSIDNGPADIAVVTPTYDSTVPVPLVAVPFSVASYGAIIEELMFDLGAEIGTPEDIAAPDGYGEIRITNRDPQGSFNPEAVLVATHDFIGRFKASTAQALDTGTIGTTAGNRLRVQMPAIAYREVGEGDRASIRTYDMSYGAAESSGDDEISLLFT